MENDAMTANSGAVTRSNVRGNHYPHAPESLGTQAHACGAAACNMWRFEENVNRRSYLSDSDAPALICRYDEILHTSPERMDEAVFS
ncbi:MAG TPA: hypothetical protein VF534_06090 [Paraburkholderia sp.]